MRKTPEEKIKEIERFLDQLKDGWRVKDLVRVILKIIRE